MNLFGVMGISASGLSAERTRAEVVAGNMANAESTHTAEAAPSAQGSGLSEPGAFELPHVPAGAARFGLQRSGRRRGRALDRLRQRRAHHAL